MKGQAVNFGRLWILWASSIMALRIPINTDTFPRITRATLKESLPKMLTRPSDLGNLLRFRATNEFGISSIITESCFSWTLDEWRIIGELVKNRPWLASILISSECIELFSEAQDSSEEALRDCTFQARYEFALKLFPLLLYVDSEESIELLLSNIGVVDAHQLDLWFDRNPFSVIINTLYNNQKVLNSGITHRFLLPATYEELCDIEPRKSYSSMLKAIQQPAELFGHAAHLKSLLNTIDVDRKSKQQYDVMDEIEEFVRTALEDLEKRLPLHTDDFWSVEQHCYRIYSMSKEEVLKNANTINSDLQECDTFTFQQMITAIIAKLDYGCRDFLSEENRARLLNNPSITINVSAACQNRNERITWYHRWMRELVNNIPPRKFADFSESIDYVQANFHGLPLELNGMPLESFLDSLQQETVEGAQLVITAREGITYIDVRNDLDIQSELMNDTTPVYLFLSIVRQLYLRSSEVFEKSLLDWIEILANREEDGPIKFLYEAANPIYP